MILIDGFEQALAQIEKERGINRQLLIEAIRAALLAASRKKYGNTDNLDVTIDEKSGEALIFASKEVVEEVDDEYTQVALSEAQEYQDDVEIGDVIMMEVTPDDFGRIAIQTAKQVILQKIREAEKDSISGEFESKIGSIVTAIVQRKEGRNYLLNLGRIEAILGFREQIPGERYNPKDLIKVYVSGVEQSTRGPRIMVSRTHPGLVRALFELEVPEIHDGIIEVVSVAREPGQKAKVAVKSNDPDVGAVGTCVGHMGGRIQNIVKALGNEKIDIIEWTTDTMELIVNALKPAAINKIRLEENTGEGKKAIVNVNEDQLSLAIGRGGQNVRLASKLTGWHIDIQSEKTSFMDNLKKAVDEEKKDTNLPTEEVETTTEPKEIEVPENAENTTESIVETVENIEAAVVENATETTEATTEDNTEKEAE